MLFLVLLILCCLVEVVPGTLLSVCLGIVMYLSLFYLIVSLMLYEG